MRSRQAPRPTPRPAGSVHGIEYVAGGATPAYTGPVWPRAAGKGGIESMNDAGARGAREMSRWRNPALLTWVLLCCFAAGAARAAETFDLQTVVDRAEALARESFQDPRGQIPDWLLEISYDQWRDIRFRPEHALWRDKRLPFEVQFFHPGFLYNRRVAIHVVDAAGVHPVGFAPSQFDYGENKFGSQVPQDLGYAGFRLHFPLNRPDYKDEVIVFLGASYFRAVAKGQGFGLSARAVAVDTAQSWGEEFPYFREFWIARPSPKDRQHTVYALLDGPRITGAYRFIVQPGERTVVEVESRLFFRERIEKLGVAPLTSMFFIGENLTTRPPDYRPEVHDSDGLLVLSPSGEWIWRPLRNPERLRVTSFEATNPAGFGLLQRDREFDHYQDLEARPDRRPSTWVTPRGDWGEGRVELVEIPTRTGTNDNIVAYWIPADAADPERPRSFAYTLEWYLDDPNRPPAGRVVATRRDRGTFEDAYRYVIDFEGSRLARLDQDTVLRAVVTLGSGDQEQGEILEQQAIKNPVTKGWRLIFQVRPSGGDPVDIRAFLQLGQEALTETWTDVLDPE